MGIKMSRERRGRIKGKFDNNLEDFRASKRNMKY